jgi:intracellular sulfur oxidation DsrE/DsrF family protein
MSKTDSRHAVARRSFITRIGGGAAALGATLGTTLAAREIVARADTPAADGHWQPVRHPQDDWFDQVPGKHRLLFDTTTPDTLEDAIQFAGNFFSANKGAYGLENGDLAVVIVMRHRSAPFAYGDAIWAKYSETLARRADWVDPKTKQVPKVNYFTPTAPAAPARPRGIANLIALGVQFAVCDLSTHAIAGLVARDAGITADAAYKEITSNLVGSGRLVPAGIVAVSRAQERGYTKA